MARIAMPLAEDFEDSEFKKPYDQLRDAGHQVTVLGSKPRETLTGKRGEQKATVECRPDQVKASDFDALVIPGGYSPDHLRTDQDMVAFVKDFGALGRPIAAVCHGPQLLIEADLVRGKRMTSWPSVRTDLVNAGATWVDEQVCKDGNLITSRNPGDLDAFSRALLSSLSEA